MLSAAAREDALLPEDDVFRRLLPEGVRDFSPSGLLSSCSSLITTRPASGSELFGEPICKLVGVVEAPAMVPPLDGDERSIAASGLLLDPMLDISVYCDGGVRGV